MGSPLNRWLALWLGLGLLLALADRLLWDTLWVLTLGIWLLYAGLGLLLLGLAARLALQRPRGRRKTAQTVGVVLAATGLLILGLPRVAVLGDDWLFRYRFAEARPVIEATVAHLEREASAALSDPRQVLIDDGPPRRLAWRLPGGIIDNWEAVVYDPSGAVRSARGFTSGGGFTASADVVKLFGGDLVTCEPVGGPYFRCWFT